MSLKLKTGVFFIFFIFLYVKYSFAEIKSVHLHVEGLSCPFCALGLEKQLKRVEAVGSVNVQMKKARVDLTLKKQSRLEFPLIQKAVKEAGFTLKDIEVLVSGVILKNEDDFYILKSHEDGNEFLLFDKAHVDAGANSSNVSVLNIDLEKKLSVAQKEKRIVEIKGIVHDHLHLPMGLMVEEIKVYP